MTRTMYDGVTARDIPSGVDMVAGYIDGRYAWTQWDWTRFPRASKVRVATSASTPDGDVLDVEPGDATPDQARTWVANRHGAGLAHPVVYCPLAMLADVQRACSGLAVWFWTADWTGHPHVTPGAIATQYADPSTSGGHYDLSLVAADWWCPSPSPTPIGGLDVLQLVILVPDGSQTQWLWNLMTDTRRALDLQAEAQGFINAGVHQVECTTAFLDNITQRG